MVDCTIHESLPKCWRQSAKILVRVSLSTAKPQAPTDVAQLAQLRVRNRRTGAEPPTEGDPCRHHKNRDRRPRTRPSWRPRLKQLPAEHGLSLSQLARATGISSSFLSLIEQAQSDVTIGRLVRLAEFYDVELADLLNGPPTAPADHVRILRTAPEHMLHSPTEGVDVYDLTCGARWTLVPTLSTFRPGGSIEIDDEHEHERMIYILDGTFELVFPGEAPTRLRTGRARPSTAWAGIASPTSAGDKAAFSQSASTPKLTRTGGGGPPAPLATNKSQTPERPRQESTQGEPAARPYTPGSSARRWWTRRGDKPAPA